MKTRILKSLLLIVFFILAFESNAKNNSRRSKDGLVSHKVKSGESLYKIANRYGVTIKDIQRVNPLLKDLTHLKLGQIIRVPEKNKSKNLTTSKSNTKTDKNKVSKEDKVAVNKKLHTVKKGQSLYMIAKVYHISVDDLKKWNKISGKNLKVGSKLIINQKTIIKPSKVLENAKPTSAIDTKTENIDKQKANPVSDVSLPNEGLLSQKELSKYFNRLSVGGLEGIKGTGASMITASSTKENTYFALHKSLPVGTIIRIRNMVNSKVAYAKVIGRLEENEDNKHVIIRYSDAVKKLLLLKDGKCYVQIEYVK